MTEHLQTDYAITNVRAVVGDHVIDQATIEVQDGTIVDLRSGATAPRDAIDGHGAYLLPGVICTHSDGVEREIWPRPNTRFPVDFALRSFESRLQGAGVTTVFHGVGFDHKPNYDRTIEQALELCEVIGERRNTGSAPACHLVLHRVEARSEHGWAEMEASLGASSELGHLPLVSFEDHSVGQGQYHDVERYKRFLDPAHVPEGETAETVVAQRLAEAEALAGRREERLRFVSDLAGCGRIRLLAHDLENAEEATQAAQWGASVAEFPISRGAAQVARDQGMDVVMGAPNVLRGGSHTGNVAAAELVEAGLCTALASDYQPSTMLAAALKLVDDGICSFPHAIGLITSGPASVAGLDDRGVLEVGRRADLVLVSIDGSWPRVHATWRAADRITAMV